MDVKLPSVDGERVAGDTQRQFLDTAVGAGATAWVKIVIGASTDPDQFDQAVGMVAEAARLGRDPNRPAAPAEPMAVIARRSSCNR